MNDCLTWHMWLTTMHFSAKCNSGRIAIQWLHIKRYLDHQYTKFKLYIFWVQHICVFARYATLVPRLSRCLQRSIGRCFFFSFTSSHMMCFFFSHAIQFPSFIWRNSYTFLNMLGCHIPRSVISIYQLRHLIVTTNEQPQQDSMGKIWIYSYQDNDFNILIRHEIH